MASSCPHLAEARSVLMLLLVLLLLSPLILAQELLPVGFSNSFSPGETTKFWVSESGGSHTFGFKALAQPRQYLLAIWRSRDPEQTPIWWAAAGEGPALATPESSFLYNESSGFLQLQASPSRLLWRSASSGSVRFPDTGNLQLVDGNVSAWETFQDHRNTLMLSSLTRSNVRNKTRLLQSTENQTSYANGKFHMATHNSFVIALFGIDQLRNQYVYMNNGNMRVNISGPGGSISIGNQKDDSAHISRDPELERLTLDYDGNLRVYSWSEDSAAWEAVWTVLPNSGLHCRAANPCGPFGICQVGTNACSCPPGYSPVSSTDTTRGCRTSSSLPGCGRPDNQLTVMAELPGATFYYNDLYHVEGVRDVEECKGYCLRACACMAATFEDSRCQLKGNFTLGYMNNGISRRNTMLLMKLLKPAADAAPLPTKGWPSVPIIVFLSTLLLIP